MDRQRQAFVADGPPSVDVRRDRIDRLLALVLDNTDAFVDAARTARCPPARGPTDSRPCLPGLRSMTGRNTTAFGSL